MEKRVLHICPALGSGGIEKLIIQWNEIAEQQGIKFIFAVYKSGGDAYEYFENKGYSIYELKRLKDIGFRAYKQQIKDIAQKEKISILHINAGTLTGFTLRAARDAGIQARIVHAHTNKYNLPNNKVISSILLKYARKMNNDYSTVRLGCSIEAAEYCFGVDSAFRVLHNGVDLDAFRYSNNLRANTRNELGISDERIVVGFVGRLTKQKNPLFLLDIYKGFKQRALNSTLLIVGDGDLREEMQRKIDSQGIEDVIFVGAKKDVIPYYTAMDVVVMPSLYEGLPIVAVEAQAIGTPIVISEHVPKEVMITELVKQVHLRDPVDKWLDAISSLCNKGRKEYRDVLLANGYDKNETAREMISIYEEEIARITSE